MRLFTSTIYRYIYLLKSARKGAEIKLKTHYRVALSLSSVYNYMNICILQIYIIILIAITIAMSIANKC